MKRKERYVKCVHDMRFGRAKTPKIMKISECMFVGVYTAFGPALIKNNAIFSMQIKPKPNTQIPKMIMVIIRKLSLIALQFGIRLMFDATPKYNRSHAMIQCCYLVFIA